METRKINCSLISSNLFLNLVLTTQSAISRKRELLGATTALSHLHKVTLLCSYRCLKESWLVVSSQLKRMYSRP